MEKNYLRMIRVMNARRNQGQREWSVYLVRCADGSLYTGIAKDVEARIEKHNQGQGSAYARSRAPVVLVYREGPKTRSQALVREAAIKAMSRPQKERLVEAGSSKQGRRKPKAMPGRQVSARATRKWKGRSSKTRRL